MRKLILLFFFLCSAVYATPVQLKEKLSLAQPGSYLVIEQSKVCTLLFIRERLNNAILLEEVCVPSSIFAAQQSTWKEWFEKGAQGHTSWIISQVNVQTGAFEETFSHTRNGWVDMTEAGAFFTSLLNLSFNEVSTTERRRIGLPPSYRKADTRPLWNPRLVVDGQIVRNVVFAAYKARWPGDGTELSHKVIEIYLPQASSNQESASYPLYFPYWLEVDGKYANAKIRVIDSGMNAHSPKGSLPLRPAQLMDTGSFTKEGLVFHLKSPPYYTDFLVIAQADELFFGGITPLQCKTINDGQGNATVVIPQEELNQLSSENELYRFSISPKENPFCTLDSAPLAIKSNQIASLR